MKKSFHDVLTDIENNLIGIELNSISGNAAAFVISKVDYLNSAVILSVQGKRKTWTFERLQKVWNEMYYRPAANVEIVFGGSGSSRNQVETIFASMAYVEWLYVNSKKCIAYVGEETHKYGSLMRMTAEKEQYYQKLMGESVPRNPLLEPDEMFCDLSGNENKKYQDAIQMLEHLDALRSEWMDKDNQEFILSCLDFMKAHGLFTDATLEILQSKEQCATKFRHNSLNGILLRVDQDLSEDEQRKDANGNARYYSEKYTISEDSYFVSSEWRPDREDARKPLIDWIFEMLQKVKFNTGYQSDYPRNRILFGAPGTGKSFTLNYEKDLLLADGGEYERVTFHPDYSYANFVGTYKPVPCKDSDGKDAITYSYVPGPFMRTYVKALQNSRTDAPKPFLLVIEEINRANVAAVFGDVFQLLDRGDDEVSEYPIQASEDIKKYLAGELGGNPDDYAEIRIPDNMFIWATMNSADQGVFPMDTAFKRRWDFTYLGIDDSEAGIVGKKVILGQGDYRCIVEWNTLRKAINDELLTYKVNEDKLMGPYFISKKNLPEGEMIDPAVFTRIFKNKVIMYLFDDAAKQKRITLFGGCDEKAKNQYSKICREFDTKGVYIFCEGISSQFIDNVPEDDGE